MKTPNIHTAEMREYLEERIYDEKAYLNWEHSLGNRWRTLSGEPTWAETLDYRRKPRMIKIGKYEVPEPMREAPADGVKFWMANVGLGTAVSSYWDGIGTEPRRLALGLCHTTKEAAQLHVDALLSFTKTGGSDE